MGLLPTPDCSDKKSAKSKQQGLSNVVKGLLATPSARDEKGEGGNGKDLNRDLGIVGRQLNPQFVAEMMSFPENWTELPFLNGEMNQSKDMATQ